MDCPGHVRERSLIMLEQGVQARVDRGGFQTIEVAVNGGYRPSTIVARAGVPLRIIFRRTDADPCTERVVFSAPRLERRLVPNGTTTVDLPAQPPGEIRFTCGMGRYRGQIELIADSAPSIARRLRERASRIETPLGIALILWICSLPLIALVAVLAFDGTAAIAAAGLGLLAWLAGCLWAFGRSTTSA